MTDSRPRVLAILPGIVPSTLICVAKPLLHLHHVGMIHAKVTLEYLASRHDLEWADLVVFCRNTEPEYAYLLDFMQSRKIPFTFDLDDNFFELPLDSELGRYHRNSERLAMLTRYLKSANLVRVYSNPLLEGIQAMNQKVERVFGPIDSSLISSPKKNSKMDKVSIVYATSRIYAELTGVFLPALPRLLNEYGKRVEIHFWCNKPDSLAACRGVQYHTLISSYDRFLRKFSQAGYDIGLAPLLDDIFHRSKTNNKFREYGACRIAGIYSNVDVYSTCVTDGETGLLVSNELDSWYHAIVRLIEDPDLREKIQRQAQEYVRRHYSQADFEKIWLNHIERVLTERRVCFNSGNPVAKAYPEKEDMNRVDCPVQGPSASTHLGNQIQKGIMHLRRRGPRFTYLLLRRYLYGQWEVLKLRFRQ